MQQGGKLMYDTVLKLLDSVGITLCKPLPLNLCKIQKAYLLEKYGIISTDSDCDYQGTVFMFAIPYLVPEANDSNISAYAVPRDYHKFVADLSNSIVPQLKAAFPDNEFALFSDHSPIDERTAAALAGIGVLGKNGTVITDSYSSFVFLGEIITDAILELPVANQEYRISYCEGCNKCIEACPTRMKSCLSAITQKKGVLTADEEKLIIENGCAWGCDVCQLVCPHTKAAFRKGTILSKIPFFNESTTSILNVETIEKMARSEFEQRAYSWRGKETIIRNLKLLGYY